MFTKWDAARRPPFRRVARPVANRLGLRAAVSVDALETARSVLGGTYELLFNGKYDAIEVLTGSHSHGQGHETTFAHCTIHVPWTGRVRRMIAQDWADLQFLHGGPLYALIPPDDVKLQRFATIFGLEPELTLTDLTTGVSRLIFRTKD